MFKKIWNFFFGWLGNDKATTQALIQLMAAEGFKNNTALAKKVLPGLNTLISSLNAGTILNGETLNYYIASQMNSLKLEPAELATMNLMVSNMKAKIADKKIPINNMADVAEYVGWIRDIATYYAAK